MHPVREIDVRRPGRAVERLGPRRPPMPERMTRRILGPDVGFDLYYAARRLLTASTDVANEDAA